MEQAIDDVVASLGLEGVALLVIYLVLAAVCRLFAKLIPDDATGWKKIVRQVCAVVSLYVSNRISKGTTQPQAIRQAGRLAVAANQRLGPVEETLEKIPVRGAGGKFESSSKTKLGSHWIASLMALLMVLGLSGCVRTPEGDWNWRLTATHICRNLDAAQFVLDLAWQKQPEYVDLVFEVVRASCPSFEPLLQRPA